MMYQVRLEQESEKDFGSVVIAEVNGRITTILGRARLDRATVQVMDATIQGMNDGWRPKASSEPTLQKALHYAILETAYQEARADALRDLSIWHRWWLGRKLDGICNEGLKFKERTKL